METRIVVLGAGYAGLLCAGRLARGLGGRAQVTLVSASEYFVERVRLHQRAAGNHPARHAIAELVRGSAIQARIGRAADWRPAEHTVRVDGVPLSYDRLVYALGSATDLDAVPGVREHALSLDDGGADRLARALPACAAAGGRLAVVGGGATAIEAAAELKEAFPQLRVTLVAQGAVGDRLSQAARAHLASVYHRLGVERIENTAVRAVSARSLATDGAAIPFDLCLWAGGFRAAPLAAEAGLPVNARGQLLVDEHLRCPADPVLYGAGDACAPTGAAGAPLVMGCKSAMPLAAHAADNLIRELDGRVPARFGFGDGVVCLSLGRKEGLIQRLGRDGALRERIWKGRFAAWVKELICRYAAASLRWQITGRLRYRWLAPGPARAALGGGELPPTKRLAA